MKWQIKEFISLRKLEDGSILWNNKNCQKKQKIDTTQTRVDGKSSYIVENPPDGFVIALKVANSGNLLLIAATLPINFSEVERTASGIQRLKTVFRSSMKDDQECNLNLL